MQKGIDRPSVRAACRRIDRERLFGDNSRHDLDVVDAAFGQHVEHSLCNLAHIIERMRRPAVDLDAILDERRSEPQRYGAAVESGSPTSARKRRSTRLTNTWNESSSRDRQPAT
jgi:hypothetical protein